MRIRFKDLSLEALQKFMKEYHVIKAIALDDPTFSKRVYGGNFCPPLVGDKSPAFETKVLTVGLDTAEGPQIDELVEMIKQAKGA